MIENTSHSNTNIAGRFEKTVFRVCMDCGRIRGCHNDGKKAECPCNKNCVFGKSKLSKAGLSFLDEIDSSTSTLCNRCSTLRIEQFKQEIAENKLCMNDHKGIRIG